MTYEIFTANTFAGMLQIAVQIGRDNLPGDSRTDAHRALESELGRGAGRVLDGSKRARKLVGDYRPIRGTDWAFSKLVK